MVKSAHLSNARNEKRIPNTLHGMDNGYLPGDEGDSDNYHKERGKRVLTSQTDTTKIRKSAGPGNVRKGEKTTNTLYSTDNSGLPEVDESDSEYNTGNPNSVTRKEH